MLSHYMMPLSNHYYGVSLLLLLLLVSNLIIVIHTAPVCNVCSVTGYKTIEVLRASHIKPWRFSSNLERLDPYNGLLLLPNLDVLFDFGLISFEDNGQILISNLLAKDTLNVLSIHEKMKLRLIKEEHKSYLEYHRKNLFRN